MADYPVTASNGNPRDDDFDEVLDTPGAPSQQRSVLDYLQIVKTKLWMIFGVTMIVVLATYIYAWHMATPMYSAWNTIKIEQPKLTSDRRSFSPQDHEVYFNTQAQYLTQRGILLQTAQQCHIEQWPEYRGMTSQPLIEALKDNISIDPIRGTNYAEVTVLSRNAGNARLLAYQLLNIWKSRIDEQHNEERNKATQDIQAAITRGNTQIDAFQSEIKSLQMQIRQSTEDEIRLNMEMTRENQLLTQLTGVQLSYRTAVEEYRYFMDTQPPSLEVIAQGPVTPNTLPYIAAYEVLNASLPAWEVELTMIDQDYRTNALAHPMALGGGGSGDAAMVDNGGSEGALPSTGDVRSGVRMINPLSRVEMLEQRLLQVREEIQYYKTVYTPEQIENRPEVIRAYERLKSQVQALSQAKADAEQETSRQIYNYLLGSVTKLDAQEQHLQRRLEGIELDPQNPADSQLIAERRREIENNPNDLNVWRKWFGQIGVVQLLQNRILEARTIAIDIEKIQRQIEIQDSINKELITKKQETLIEIPPDANNIQVMNDEPAVSSEPTKPNKPILMIMAVFGGLALGTGLALAVTMIDTNIRTPADIRSSLGSPILGFIANMEGQADDFGSRALIAHDLVRSAAAESFREVRSRLFALYKQQPFTSILVTSTTPQEGKTTVAVNLAISLAHAGRKVLVIDTRLRHPNLHLLFNLDQAPGLNEAVSGEVSLDEVIAATEIPGLSVIPGGMEPISPAEQLGSGAMEDLMRQVSERFDFVIVDGSPVLGISDTLVLADKVDTALFVVKSAKTKRSVVSRAKHALNDAGIEVLGTVINDVRYSRGDFYYYAKHY